MSAALFIKVCVVLLVLRAAHWFTVPTSHDSSTKSTYTDFIIGAAFLALAGWGLSTF